MPKAIAAIPSILCLGTCLVVPVLHFQGRIGADTYKSLLLAASAGWFVFAAILAARRKK